MQPHMCRKHSNVQAWRLQPLAGQIVLGRSNVVLTPGPPNALQVRRLGLKSALSAKAHEGRLLLVDSLAPEVPKTKLLASKLEGLLAGQPRRSCLLVDSAKEGHDGGAWLRRAAGNLAGVEVVPQIGTNVYSILKRDVLVMTVPAAEALIARLRAPINRLGAAGRAYAARMAAKRAAQPPQA